jgi:Holliday junction DNA helicase RuvB
VRTARGRMVTNKCWRHFGLVPPRRAAVEDLFGSGDSGLVIRDSESGPS